MTGCARYTKKFSCDKKCDNFYMYKQPINH
nr:MAG TPA: hypothetical protein [Caudoviricetes sp.]